jgi:pimeloyl-ACP methyl ester carboxylesterase
MKHRSRAAGALLVAVAMLGAVTGCWPRADHGATRTLGSTGRLEAITCPADVEAQVVARHECLRLVIGSRPSTAPASAAALQPVHLFVVRVHPSVAPTGDPIVVVGTDYAIGTDYVGTAPIAQRTGRVLYMVDQRGTGHSTPSLACPEVDQLRAAAAGTTTADLGTQSRVATAVGACRTRLASQGVDPTQFTAAHAAEDVARLAEALHLSRWVVDAHGSASLTAIAYARAHQGQVAALVLDSPELAPHGPADQVRALEPAVDALAAACGADPACHRAYGDVRATWQRALATLDRAPLKVRTDQAVVPVDATTLRRLVQLALGEPPLGPSVVPALVADAARRRIGPTMRELVTRFAAAPPYCAGLQPKCRESQPTALGVALAERCSLETISPTTPDPWARACHTWGGTTVPGEAQSGSLDVPALVLLGRYDPFADPTAIRAQLAVTLPDATVVEDPASGHNVLAGDCLRTVRNIWTAELMAGQPDHNPKATCLTSRRVQFRLPTGLSGTATKLPNGTYQYRMSVADIINASGDRSSQEDAINNAGVTTWRLQDGRWSIGPQTSESTAAATDPCAGLVSVRGNLATFTRTVNNQPEGDCAPYRWTARFTLNGDTLSWSSVSITDFGWVFAAKPWHRVQ